MGNKSRIEYLDALRGITMLLVVYSHVVFIGYDNVYSHNSYNQIFLQLRMPLFFFISGFLFYSKGHDVQRFGELLSLLKKKFLIQIIPTAVFLLAYVLLFKGDFLESVLREDKSGYWFTLVLFYFFAINSFVNYLFNGNRNWKISAHLLSYLLIMILVFILRESVLRGLLSLGFLQHYIFFLFGNLAKYNYPKFLSVIQKLAPLLLSLFVVGCCVMLYGLVSHRILVGVFFILNGLCGICLALLLSVKHQEYLSNKYWVGKILQFAGKRTLEIYLLHYFFLPQDLSVIGGYFYNYSNPVIELFVTLLIASWIVFVSLLTSSIIKLSPFLKLYLFGKRD
ncbi:MAG: acyltransferase [Bacteroidaceae bacterium]|nr:acyltransferase [Bacteroidaceae bacterium]